MSVKIARSSNGAATWWRIHKRGLPRPPIHTDPWRISSNQITQQSLLSRPLPVLLPGLRALFLLIICNFPSGPYLLHKIFERPVRM